MQQAGYLCTSSLYIPEVVPSKVFVNNVAELLVIWYEELTWNEGLGWWCPNLTPALQIYHVSEFIHRLCPSLYKCNCRFTPVVFMGRISVVCLAWESKLRFMFSLVVLFCQWAGNALLLLGLFCDFILNPVCAWIC